MTEIRWIGALIAIGGIAALAGIGIAFRVLDQLHPREVTSISPITTPSPTPFPRGWVAE